MSVKFEHYNLSYLVYKKIKSMIINQELLPGQKINQEKLASDLGISRMPLHPAFQKLENEMLVELIPRRGVFVKKIDKQLLADAFECREIIEGLAARHAAAEITDKEVKALKDIFSPFRKDPGRSDIEKYEEADKIFHNKIKSFLKNRIIEKVESLDNVVAQSYQTGLIRDPGITYFEHMEIIEALANHDSLKAETLVREHFYKSRKMIVEKLQVSE
ncbi:MAG: GntR family transcriptional regulator [Bacteroidales bacterium]|nr:GntR family transcriptional regulator [Bacteroidales bacterium]